MKKTEKNYLDAFFGFPILIDRVNFFKFEDSWVADIDYQKLKKVILKHLVFCKFYLNGNHINFIRFCSNYSLDKFCEKFNLIKANIVRGRYIKYIPSLDWHIEKELRLYILRELLKDDKNYIINVANLDQDCRRYSNFSPIRISFGRKNLVLCLHEMRKKNEIFI